MDNLFLVSTANSPLVLFEEEGKLLISGKVTPDTEDDFWTPIRKWLNCYTENPAKQTVFHFQLECLNTSSSKEILQILYGLNELNERGYNATVQWDFHNGDIDMLEVGRDYEHLVKVPFVFVSLSYNSLV